MRRDPIEEVNEDIMADQPCAVETCEINLSMYQFHFLVVSPKTSVCKGTENGILQDLRDSACYFIKKRSNEEEKDCHVRIVERE